MVKMMTARENRDFAVELDAFNANGTTGGIAISCVIYELLGSVGAMEALHALHGQQSRLNLPACFCQARRGSEESVHYHQADYKQHHQNDGGFENDAVVTGLRLGV